ncbi:MAG: hypothetical protein WC756_02605 [Taibaiella sp.]|jgi:hypothetical protein
MERIKNILQRLQELYYSNHQKSAIDADLMLDYTRVMYADLLEWRKQFKEPPTTETAEKNTQVITSEEEKEESKEQPVNQEQQAAAEEEELLPDTKPENEKKAELKVEENEEDAIEQAGRHEPEKAAVQEEAIFTPIERDEPTPKEPVIEEANPVVDIHPEKESVDALMTDTSGISFEPPAKYETKSEAIKEELAVETPIVNQSVEEMPAPTPTEIPLPDMAPPKKIEPLQSAQLFHAAKAANKDIRSSIGINDKYLFLNELFNNHKSNYEETLDKLNHFSNIDQAKDWILTKVAPVQKWDKDDATVQGFYAILAKHFSDR